MSRIEALAGVLPALVSPMTEHGTVDEPAVARLVTRMIDGGVSGLLALGSTGETASLDEPARRAMLAAVVKACAGRVPVLCGVAQTHLHAAEAEVEAAARLGADACLVAPPFYYLIDQATVMAFYRQLARQSALPLLYYHIPQYTKVVAEPATIAKLASEGTVVGIKDSSRDFEYFEAVRMATRELPEFRVFTGSDTMLLASLAFGGDGTICGAANVAPEWIVRVYDDFRRGDLDAARAGQDRVYELVMAVRAGVFPAAIKAALEMQGICEPWLAPPVQKLPDGLTAKLRGQLEEWHLLTTARSRR